MRGPAVEGAALVVGVVLSFMAKLSISPVAIPLNAVLALLGQKVGAVWQNILFGFRLPRGIDALCSGADIKIVLSAIGVAKRLYIGLAFVLPKLSHNAPMPPVVSVVITTQLVSLLAPAMRPPQPPVAVPMPAIAVPGPVPKPEPVVETPQVQQTDLVLKRMQQERQEKGKRAHRA